MVKPFVDPSPGGRSERERRKRQVQEFWTQLYVGENPGETTWEELDALHDQVNSALAANPPDVTRAETLTAYAALLMTGLSDF
jgi:hypothetical protein